MHIEIVWWSIGGFVAGMIFEELAGRPMARLLNRLGTWLYNGAE